jgi:hypothetical protein
VPGSILAVTPDSVLGWARHPRHAHYRMLVHLVVDGLVHASTLADGSHEAVGSPGAGGWAFNLPCAETLDRRRVRVLLGETDEYLPHTADTSPVRRRILTVEDLVATELQRPWVDGTCYMDGLAAGLLPETVIDLLCRDYLGRPAGPVVLNAALAQLGSGDYDDVRRTLLSAGEYRHRRIRADVAPGTIFAQRLVMSVASRDYAASETEAIKIRQVSARSLLELDGDAFVTACYRQILRKEPDRPGLSHYLNELAAGTRKLDIIRHLANEFETISAGTQVVDLPDQG